MSGVSVIVPVYNGQKFIIENIKKLRTFLCDNFNEFEIIVVNDGSTDRTQEVLSSFTFPELKVLSYKENKGRGFAIRQGFFNCIYNNVIYTDADLPYSFTTMLNLIKELENSQAGMVICSRVIPDSIVCVKYNDLAKIFMRWIAGRIINFIIRLFLGIPYKDTQAGLKGFNKQKLKNLFSISFVNRWAFDCEIIYLSYTNRIEIKEIPAFQHADYEVSTVKILDGIKYILDVVRIFFKHKMEFTF